MNMKMRLSFSTKNIIIIIALTVHFNSVNNCKYITAMYAHQIEREETEERTRREEFIFTERGMDWIKTHQHLNRKETRRTYEKLFFFLLINYFRSRPEQIWQIAIVGMLWTCAVYSSVFSCTITSFCLLSSHDKQKKKRKSYFCWLYKCSFVCISCVSHRGLELL